MAVSKELDLTGLPDKQTTQELDLSGLPDTNTSQSPDTYEQNLLNQQSLQEQQARQIEEAQALQRRDQAAQDLATASSDRLDSLLPTPRTAQDKAKRDVLIEQRKAQEEGFSESLLPKETAYNFLKTPVSKEVKDTVKLAAGALQSLHPMLSGLASIYEAANTDLGKNFIRGAAFDIASKPQQLAGLTLSFGENMEQNPDFWDLVQGPIGQVHFQQKLATSLIARFTPVDEAIQKLSIELINANRKFLYDNPQLFKQHGTRFIDSIAYGMGQGSVSLASAIGLTVATRNPEASVALFSSFQKGSIYTEARQAGINPYSSDQLSTTAGLLDGGFQYIGLKTLLGGRFFGKQITSKIGKLLASATEGAVSQAGQTALQQAGEELVAKLGGFRKSEFEDIISRMSMSVLIGALLGSTTRVIHNSISEKGLIEELKLIGLPESVANQVAYEAVVKGRQTLAPLLKEHLDTLISELPGMEGKVKMSASEELPDKVLPNAVEPELIQSDRSIVAEKVARGQALDDLELTDHPDLADIQHQLTGIRDKIKSLRDAFQPVPDSLMKRHNALLESLGVDPSKRPKTPPNVEKLLGRTPEKMTIEERTALKRSLRRQEQAARRARIAEKKRITETLYLRKKIKEADIQNMASEEKAQIKALQEELKSAKTLPKLRELFDKAMALKEQGKEKYLANKQNRIARLEQMRDTLIQVILKGEPLVPEKPFTKENRVDTNYAKLFFAMTWTPEIIFDHFDSGKAQFNGPFHKFFYDQVNRAVSEEAGNVKFFTGQIMDSLKESKIKSEDLSTTLTIDGIPLTLQERMHIYGVRNNLENTAAIVYGNKIPISTVNKVYDSLTDSQKTATDKIVSLLSERFPQVQETMNYVTDGKIQIEPVKGGYVSMNRANSGVVNAKEEAPPLIKDKLEKELFNRNNLRDAFPTRDFTKPRVEVNEENQAPIQLGLIDIAMSHISDREHFISLYPIVRDLHWMAGDPELRQAIVQKFGREYYDRLDKYTNRIADEHFYKAFNQLDRIVSAARQNAAVFYIGFNVLSMANQVSAIPLFLSEMGLGDLLSGIWDMSAHFEKNLKFISERSSQMANRSIDRELEEFKLRLGDKGYKQIISRVGQEGFRGLYFFDKIVALSGWLGKYKSMARKPGVSELEAIEAADKTIFRTQNAGHQKDISEIYATNEFMNVFLMFTNQLNKIWGMTTYTTPTQITKGNRSQGLLGATGLLTSAMIIWMIQHGRVPDEADEFGEAAVQQLISSVPIFGSIINSTRQGFDNTPIIFKSFQSASQSVDAFLKGKPGKGFEKAFEGISYTFGIPFAQPRRTVKGIMDLSSGKTNDYRRLIYSKQALQEKK